MTKYPEYVEVGGKLYKIDTDFKTAIECQRISQQEIRGEERALAIIYLLFGDEGLNNPPDYKELIKKGLFYLSCGKELNDDNSELDMDYSQDESYIKASFYTDYAIPNVYETNMHWWEFMDLLNGLKPDCVLNRVREIRTYDTSGIKDQKTLDAIRKQKEAVALKKQTPKLSEEQEKSVEQFIQQMGFRKR